MRVKGILTTGVLGGGGGQTLSAGRFVSTSSAFPVHSCVTRGRRAPTVKSSVDDDVTTSTLTLTAHHDDDGAA